MVVVVAAFGRADVDDEDEAEAEAVVVVVVLKMNKDSILMKNDVMRTRWQMKLIVPIVHTICIIIMCGRPVRVCRLAASYDTRKTFSLLVQ